MKKSINAVLIIRTVLISVAITAIFLATIAMAESKKTTTFAGVSVEIIDPMSVNQRTAEIAAGIIGATNQVPTTEGGGYLNQVASHMGWSIYSVAMSTSAVIDDLGQSVKKQTVNFD